LARMLATQVGGGGSLPVGLGLTPPEFIALLRRHFPGATLPVIPDRPLPAWDPRLLEEKEELIKLLDLHRAFLYKQLCEQEGIYLCRAPSCAVCRDYTLCFGPEDG